MQRRVFLALIGSAGAAATTVLNACASTNTSGPDPAKQRIAIDAAVDLALSRLYAAAEGSRELATNAKGVLVIPDVVSVGLVVGGSHGQGALRSQGRTTGYYSAGAASVGLLAGAHSRDLVFLFMTKESLDGFRASNGWSVGADASVALAKRGASGRIDTETAHHQVIGFALSNGGLMADISFEGMKITRLALQPAGE